MLCKAFGALTQLGVKQPEQCVLSSPTALQQQRAEVPTVDETQGTLTIQLHQMNAKGIHPPATASRSHLLRQAAVDQQVWVGELLLGSQKERLGVIFDTSTDWLAVESRECDTCEFSTYDPLESSRSNQINDELTVRGFGKATVSMTEWTDTVCLATSQCVDDFGFYLIEKQEGIKEPVDGYLGLAREEPFVTGSLKNIGYKRGPSFVGALVDNGYISENIFSLEIGQRNEDKFIHFGTPLENRMKDPEAIRYVSLLDDLFWATNCQGFAFEGLENNYRFPNLDSKYVRNNQVYSVFDSESAQIVLPEFFFQPYVEKIFDMTTGKDFEVSEGKILTKCYDSFPALHFMFDKIWLTVSPNDYVVDISADQDRSLCQLSITAGSQPFIVFGLPLMMDYYIVHNDKAASLGFVPRVDSAKNGPYWGTVPSRTFSLATTGVEWDLGVSDDSSWSGGFDREDQVGKKETGNDVPKESAKKKALLITFIVATVLVSTGILIAVIFIALNDSVMMMAMLPKSDLSPFHI